MSIENMTAVWKNSKAGGTDRLVLLVLADAAQNEDRIAWPSKRFVAERCLVDERTVQRSFARLVARGEIEVAYEATRRRPTIYRILVPLDGGQSVSPVEERGDTSDPIEETPVPVGETPVSPEPKVENPKEEPKAPPVAPPAITVDHRPVTVEEFEKAHAVLAAFNEQTGGSFTADAWMKKIVMRLREHPELEIEHHQSIIARNLDDAWWEGPATPSVIYGNASQFERSMAVLTAGRLPARGRGRKGGDTAEDRWRRNQEKLAEMVRDHEEEGGERWRREQEARFLRPLDRP